MPADPRKAGKDKGNLRMELQNLLISAKLRKMEYSAIVDELSPEELKYDLFEYKQQLQNEIMPYVKRADESGNPELISKAHEVKTIYEEIIDMITERINEERKR
ncbi:MAG: hypothetical protein GXO04_03110 [Aquificae bacterium]|nr:hypothetical protein [Aquificota bacterium]